MPEIPYPLSTERLVLRRFSPEDLQAYYAYQSLPETARFLFNEARSLAECMERVGRFSRAEFSKQGDWASFVVERADQPGLIGEIALKWEEGGDAQHGFVGEIGWTLAPEGQGHGYATEAARAVLALAFNTLGFRRIQARLDAANDGSRKICERLGMSREATLRDNWYLKGEWSSEAVYSILLSEWQQPN
ncbi:RimJ/RimL family protein N-acetyltransferase [Psychromicrobium silvestre]|uniref:RimJ/RimL family protein N-acetyltransferase n=1 Tax=Psychromicrobium silvestre TaxID=1645614 RepID=A0A7Y9S8M9_9MICC|nr:GNAT family protein [Psychromicrobium silvestre]NYE95512.1 RimJ/RimL family protein N-acetyltransferase [Psychromicrobium silvestre]